MGGQNGPKQPQAQNLDGDENLCIKTLRDGTFCPNPRNKKVGRGYWCDHHIADPYDDGPPLEM